MSKNCRRNFHTARSAFPGRREPCEYNHVLPIINKFVHSSAEATTSPCDACTGSCLKTIKNCCSDYSVLVAVYAPDIMTGLVSRRGKEVDSLRRMGADAGFIIATLPDGELARRYCHELPSRMKTKPTLKDIVESIGHRVSEQVYKDLMKRYKVERVYRFRYAHDGLEMRPIRLPEEGETIRLRNVRCVKGPLGIVEKSDALYAVDLDSLVGGVSMPGKGGVNLQTSLLQYATGGSLSFF